MRFKILILLGLIPACGVQHRASGTVKTDSDVKAEVAITYPICDRPDWSYDQIMRCIELCTNYKIEVAGDEKVIDILDMVNEQAQEPEQIQGEI
jgi:hypothetical protein